jgi:acetylornithine deacetylase/succinyl-diaminopimelate desuccinylase-like protein
MLPGTNPSDVDATIRRVIGDTAVVVASLRPAVASPPSVLPPAVQREIQQVVTSLWGALPIVPNMETGATDGLFLRNAGFPVYGVSGLFADPNIDDDNRAHGLNERIGVRAFYDQLEFTYRLLRGRPFLRLLAGEPLSDARLGVGSAWCRARCGWSLSVRRSTPTQPGLCFST